jgi:anaerobic selenocysteine-containing dehydrogenase
MNLTNNIIQNTHRGEPFVFINDGDADDLGIENGETIRLVSDVGDTRIAAKLSPSCRPGQVILYNGFEPYMHENWYSQADLEPGHVKWLGLAGGYGHLQYRPLSWQPIPAEPGHVKWLGLAGGYGHLQYRPLSWQPIPADRAVRVDVEKLY